MSNSDDDHDSQKEVKLKKDSKSSGIGNMENRGGESSSQMSGNRIYNTTSSQSISVNRIESEENRYGGEKVRAVQSVSVPVDQDNRYDREDRVENRHNREDRVENRHDRDNRYGGENRAESKDDVRSVPSITMSRDETRDKISPRSISGLKRPIFSKKKTILPEYISPRSNVVKSDTPRKNVSIFALPGYGLPSSGLRPSNMYGQQRVGRTSSAAVRRQEKIVGSKETELLDITPEGDTPEGNYIIQNLEYGYDLDDINEQIENLERDCTDLASNSNFLASVFQVLDNLAFLLVICLSIISSIFALDGAGDIPRNTASYVSGIMSICAAGIEGLRSSFSLDARGKTFKDIYLRTLVIARKTRALRRARISRNDLERNLEKLREKLINLQLSMYETSLPDSTTPTSYAERIEKASDCTGYHDTLPTADFIESNIPRSRILIKKDVSPSSQKDVSPNVSPSSQKDVSPDIVDSSQKDREKDIPIVQDDNGVVDNNEVVVEIVDEDEI